MSDNVLRWPGSGYAPSHVTNRTDMRPPPTNEQLVGACQGLLLCLNPGQEVRLSQEQFRRLVELAAAQVGRGLREQP